MKKKKQHSDDKIRVKMLHTALYENMECAKFLVDYGANINQGALNIAMHLRNNEMVHYLLAHGANPQGVPHAQRLFVVGKNPAAQNAQALRSKRYYFEFSPVAIALALDQPVPTEKMQNLQALEMLLAAGLDLGKKGYFHIKGKLHQGTILDMCQAHIYWIESKSNLSSAQKKSVKKGLEKAIILLRQSGARASE